MAGQSNEGSAQGRKRLFSLGSFLATLFLGACLVIVLIVIWQLEADLTSFVDQDFVADYSLNNCRVGTALRLPRTGILGKARYYVIIVRDNDGHLLETLYEGAGGYPDPPEKPSFLKGEDVQVTYDIPEVGHETFVIKDGPNVRSRKADQ